MAICYEFNIPHNKFIDACSRKLTTEFKDEREINTYDVYSSSSLSALASSLDLIWLGKYAYFNNQGGKELPLTSLNSSISI